MLSVFNSMITIIIVNLLSLTLEYRHFFFGGGGVGVVGISIPIPQYIIILPVYAVYRGYIVLSFP